MPRPTGTVLGPKAKHDREDPRITRGYSLRRSTIQRLTALARARNMSASAVLDDLISRSAPDLGEREEVA